MQQNLYRLSLRYESYIDQLTSLNLPSLLYRFKRGDIISFFKLLNGYFELDYSNLFTLPYSGKVWRWESLANLANRP